MHVNRVVGTFSLLYFCFLILVGTANITSVLKLLRMITEMSLNEEVLNVYILHIFTNSLKVVPMLVKFDDGCNYGNLLLNKNLEKGRTSTN